MRAGASSPAGSWKALATAAAILAVAVLAIVLISVAKRGLPAINLDFFTQNAAPFGQSGGGIANAIVGTVIVIAIATLIAVPAGVLLAIFNTEFAPRRVAEAVQLTLNVLAGVPTIVIGVFIFTLVVVGRGQSAIAAALGLSIVMLPLVARATEEVLLLVPSTLREGSLALGASRARTVLTVILPTAIGGIVTATIVAVARAAGETAPLLFTCSIFVSTAITTDPRQPMATLPIVIFTSSESPSAARPADRLGCGAGADRGGAGRKHFGPGAVAADATPDRASAMTVSPNNSRDAVRNVSSGNLESDGYSPRPEPGQGCAGGWRV